MASQGTRVRIKGLKYGPHFYQIISIIIPEDGIAYIAVQEADQ